MRLRTILPGVLALALLEAATSSTKAAGRVGQLFDGIASLISHALSPMVPAIPDLRHKGGAATTTSADQPTDSGSKTMPADWNTSPKSLFV